MRSDFVIHQNLSVKLSSPLFLVT
uniref:Uncharacterized protein n=1 Tax=Arundo donax TaxID=35708 RepID=A0A0A9F0X1_ARUDO